MKKIFALLICACLLAGLAVPALALEPDATPVFVRQPQSVSVPVNRWFTLTAEAVCPNGDPVAYKWYRGNVIVGSTAEAELKASNAPDEKEYYCVAYNAALGLQAGSVPSETAVVTTRLATAREEAEECQKQIDNMLPVEEGVKQDPLYLINGAFLYLMYSLGKTNYEILDKLNIPPESVATGSEVLGGLLIPVIVPPLFLVLLPYCLAMLPVSLILSTIYDK